MQVFEKKIPSNKKNTITTDRKTYEYKDLGSIDYNTTTVDESTIKPTIKRAMKSLEKRTKTTSSLSGMFSDE